MEEKRGGARVVLPLVIGAAIAAAVWFAVTRMQSGTPAAPTPRKAATNEAGGEPAQETRQETGAETAEGSTAGKAAEEAKEGELAGDVAAPSPTTKEKMEAIQPALWDLVKKRWAEEDKVLAAAPKYEDVKDEVRKTADEMMRAEDTAETEQVLALARGELDKFWDMGGPGNADAYEHAYVARATLEIALETEPENFALLTELREAIGSTMPLASAEGKIDKSAVGALLAIVEEQRQLVLAGKADVSPDAMLVMFDWCTLRRLETGDATNAKVTIEGWQWLVDNAERGGWSSIKPFCETALAAAKEGKAMGLQLYDYGGGKWSSEDDLRLMTATGRRLPSAQALPSEFRAVQKIVVNK